MGQKVLRAVVYFLVMFFFFLGISVIADRFMAAIETITSQEKKVKFKMKNGEVSDRGGEVGVKVPDWGKEGSRGMKGISFLSRSAFGH